MRWRVPVTILGIALTAGVLGFGIGRAASLRRTVVPTSEAHRRAQEAPSAPASRSAGQNAAPRGAGTPASSGSDPIPVDTKDPTLAAQDAFLDLLLPLLSDDDYLLRKSFFAVTLRNQEAQSLFFDLVMTLGDPALLDDSGVFLTYVRDSKLVTRMADAFQSDRNPHRRAALAVALGQNIAFPEAQPTVESILSGGDARLQAAALTWLSVEPVSRNADLCGRLVPKLRDLLMSGGTSALRAAAAGALKGDASEEGTRLLVDRMLNDPDPEVQQKCVWSLPIKLHTVVPVLAGHQMTALWSVVNDDSRTAGVKSLAARLILTGADRKLGSITDEQRKALVALSKEK